MYAITGARERKTTTGSRRGGDLLRASGRETTEISKKYKRAQCANDGTAPWGHRKSTTDVFVHHHHHHRACRRADRVSGVRARACNQIALLAATQGPLESANGRQGPSKIFLLKIAFSPCRPRVFLFSFAVRVALSSSAHAGRCTDNGGGNTHTHAQKAAATTGSVFIVVVVAPKAKVL